MSQDQLPGTFFGPSNLVEMLRHRVRCQPDDAAFTFLVDGETEQVHMTYRELDRQARAIAAWLESADLVGQRALLCYPPSLEFVAAFFGCLYAKVVAVPVYPPRRNQLLSRIQAIAACADAKVALTTDSVFNRVKALTEQTTGLQELNWLATCHVPEGIEDQWQLPEIHGDTLAFLQYTSGSTGSPKGVMLSHANLVHNSALISYAFEHTRSGLGVFWLPSYHDMGLIGGILQPLYVGRPNVMMSPMAFLQRPYRWLSAITRFRATTSGGPNFAYDLCVRKISPEQRETLDLSSWRVAFNGAEPIRAETLERFVETFAPCGFRREAFYPCYGLAEATLIVSGGYAKVPHRIHAFETEALADDRVVDGESGEGPVRELVGCGQALPDEKIVIADPQTMTRTPDGRVGEIWVSGPSVAQGYWRQPEATEATFQARLKDTGEGPFLRTGDLGFIYDGELFVTGRLKDMIIVHGLNHYPQDIERTVEKCHRYLRPECGAAFTVEREHHDVLVVVQELERRTRGDLEPVFDAVRRAVSREHDMAVSAVVLIKAGSIPKTSSGKIQRNECRNAYLNGSLVVLGQWRAGDVEETLEEGTEEVTEEGTEEVTDEGTEEMVKETVGLPVAAGEGGTPRQPDDSESQAPRASVPTNGPAGGGNNRNRPAAETATGTVEVVLQEVRKVAKQRAAGLTLDSPVTEIGLDSLERLEILASLEERFGGRFPEEILPELHTCRQVAAAVEKYLGREPRPLTRRAPGTETPSEVYRIDEFPECVELNRNLEMLESLGLENPFFRVHQSVLDNKTVIDGRELINYSSFNYIGMSGDPAVSRAAKEAVDRYGTSVSASRLVSGEKELHRELESALAHLLGTEDAIAMVSGHATNESVIGHLFGPGDLILHDSLDHNSILQGALLSGARRRPFAHNDWRAADELLRQYRHEYRRVLIAIEGVYSMDGDFPDLPKFIEVKRRHKALMLIDEAHSLGTLGAGGRGIGEHFHVDPNDVELWMGTLSKGLGSCGGYIAGSKGLVQYLKYTAPTFVFATGISPANTAAALAAIRCLEAEPERVARLRERSRLFLSLAKQRGMQTGTSEGTPIVPVILGNSIHCLQVSKAMFGRGVNVQPILYPAVEESAARLRFFINCRHTDDEIRYTVDALAEELEKVDPEYLTPASSKATSSL